MDVSHVAGGLVVVVEPDPDQAAKVAAVVRELVRAELIIGESAPVVLAELDERAPDLILASALLPPGDEALIADRLRKLGAGAAHTRMLTIPLLAPLSRTSHDAAFVSLRRRKPAITHSSACAAERFAEMVRGYLDQGSAARKRHGAPDLVTAGHP